MKHETPTVAAQVRERSGSRYAQRLRKAGQLPGIIYGHKKAPVPVSVDQKKLIALLRHGTHLINLDLPGKPTETCLVKELQFGYLGDNVIHVDFARVDLSEEVEVSVHLAFVGEPEAAKKAGAILAYPLTQLEVRCRADQIPGEITVDISGMKDTLTVSDIALPPGVAAVPDGDTVVSQISFVHEEAVGETEEVGEVPAEPEVIRAAESDEPEAAE
jgi:large subunit ribosomal protein L25